MSLKGFRDLTKVVFPKTIGSKIQLLWKIHVHGRFLKLHLPMLSNFNFTDDYSLIETSVCGSVDEQFINYLSWVRSSFNKWDILMFGDEEKINYLPYLNIKMGDYQFRWI